ncbi:MAG TPA: c-type cytochrome [Xanthobacteraceae bacterium]|nr:c-type cytochrome [Xanthobacteraceae bacterium]
MPIKDNGLTPGALFVCAFVCLLGAAIVAGFATTALAADADHGKAVFQQCAACHSDKPGAIGPSLRGVFDRKSGSVDGFRYSDAMKRADLTWNEANLRQYISNPQIKVKGNRMPFGGLTNPKDLDDLIAYLKDYK